MLLCFYWLPISPDTSASSAVAMGNQAAASRPVHQQLHCAGRQLFSSPCLSLSLSLSLLALCQAPVHQSGDPGRERRAREEPTGAGANSERAHQRAQVQVSRTSIQKSQQHQQIGLDGSTNTAHSHHKPASEEFHYSKH